MSESTVLDDLWTPAKTPLYAPSRAFTSLFSNRVRDRHGRLKHVSPWHRNVRTDSGDDWQAMIMEGGPDATGFTTANGAATSVTATSLTTGTGFPTTARINGATGALAGRWVAVGPNSAGAGTTVMGIILSNTATVLTVERWVTAAAPFTTATTPNGTGTYQILPGACPAWYMGLSTTVQSGTATDTVLAGELTTGGMTRIQYTTLTHTLASASYSLANTFTASATNTINSEAIFTAQGTAGVGAAATSGVMVFENAEPNAPTLVSGDTLAQTVSVSY
jgi:hypothetical protein